MTHSAHPGHRVPDSDNVARAAIMLFMAATCVGLPFVNLPAALGLGARYDYLLLLPLLSAGYLAGEGLPSRWRSVWTLALHLVPAALCLAGTWQQAVSDSATVAGLLPISDAAGYWADAQRLLLGLDFSSLSARRPLFAGLLGVLLRLTGGDLRLTLAFLAMLVAGCLFLASESLRRTHGRYAGLVLLLLTMLFYRRFVATTLTEHLGLAAGALGFSLLWRGAHFRSRPAFLAGLAMLSLGLNARAGAFFVLPLLTLWGTLHLRRGAVLSASTLGLLGQGVAASAFGFAANTLIFFALVPPGGLPFSNFSTVLYSMMAGAQDWAFALRQHPELASLSESEQARRLYAMAWELFRDNPMRLAWGYLHAWGDLLLKVRNGFYSSILIRGPENSGIIDILLAGGFSGLGQAWRANTYQTLNVLVAVGLVAGLNLLGMAGMAVAWLQRRGPDGGLVLAAMLGLLASSPFVPPWDADNMRAYAATIPLMAVFPVLPFTVRSTSPPQDIRNVPGIQTGTLTPAVAAVILCLLCTLGPVLVRAGGWRGADLGTHACQADAQAMAYVPHGGCAVTVIEKPTSGLLFKGDVWLKDMRQNMDSLARVHTEMANWLVTSTFPVLLTSEVDARDGRTFGIVRMPPNSPERLCLTPGPDDTTQLFDAKPSP